jgi:hypothetical protein
MAVRPSRILAAWIVVAALGCAALLMRFLPLTSGVAAALLILALGAWALWQARLCHVHAVTALRCAPDELQFCLRSGQWQAGTVLDGALVTRGLTVIRIATEDAEVGHSVVVLLPDSMDADDYRRLRVHLRWRAARAGVGGRD